MLPAGLIQSQMNQPVAGSDRNARSLEFKHAEQAQLAEKSRSIAPAPATTATPTKKSRSRVTKFEFPKEKRK
jgi:hypothetical protein